MAGSHGGCIFNLKCWRAIFPSVYKYVNMYGHLCRGCVKCPSLCSLGRVFRKASPAVGWWVNGARREARSWKDGKQRVRRLKTESEMLAHSSNRKAGGCCWVENKVTGGKKIKGQRSVDLEDYLSTCEATIIDGRNSAWKFPSHIQDGRWPGKSQEHRRVIYWDVQRNFILLKEV